MTARQEWLRVLALATTADLAACWSTWPARPEVEPIRGPEAGLVMVRARIGGGGDRFNLGEATVTRATVRVGEVLGTSYVLGSDLEHARLGAIFDALLQDDRHHRTVMAAVIAPLAAAQARRDDAARVDARSTLVDFFTVAREHE